MGKRQTYRYLVRKTILGTEDDEYQLTQLQAYRLYAFYVTYSMCATQSFKKRTLIDYGWPSNHVTQKDIKAALANVLILNRNENFVFTNDDDLKTRFEQLSLCDGVIEDLSFERAVIAKTSVDNNYLKLFYRIRNCLAHGKFRLRISDAHEKMVILQDDDTKNVTARIVIRLDTLLEFVDVIDRNCLI